MGTQLMALMKAADLRSYPEGVCFGQSQMVGMAILSGGMDEFDRRSAWLETIDLETFPEELENARRKVTDFVAEARKEAIKKLAAGLDEKKEEKLSQQTRQKQLNDLIQIILEEKKKHLTEDEKITIEKSYDFLNLNIFLQAVEMHHQPKYYPDWFEKESHVFSQDASKTWPLLLPKKLEEKGVQRNSFCGAYDKNELGLYLDSLEKALKEKMENNAIALTLTSGSHAITIGYDIKTKKWVFNNIKEPPTRYFDHANNDEMKNLIFEAFESSQHVIFNTDIKSNADETKFNQFISAWRDDKDFKQIHAITRDKATEYKGAEQETLLYIAAQNNHYAMINDLISHSANIDAATIKGFKPLYCSPKWSSGRGQTFN